jgi:hypothetical protein
VSVSTAAVWTPAKAGDDAAGAAGAKPDWLSAALGGEAIDVACGGIASDGGSADAVCVGAADTAADAAASTSVAGGDEDDDEEGRDAADGDVAPDGATVGLSAAVSTAGAVVPGAVGAVAADAVACSALAVFSEGGDAEGEPIATTKEATPTAAIAEAPAPSPHFSRRARACS